MRIQPQAALSVAVISKQLVPATSMVVTIVVLFKKARLSMTVSVSLVGLLAALTLVARMLVLLTSRRAPAIWNRVTSSLLVTRRGTLVAPKALIKQCPTTMMKTSLRKTDRQT